MLTLYDYLPSQNGYKVRLLLHHLGVEYRTREVAIFAGAGQHPDFLQRNPAGAVPVLELEDGRTLPESNAILVYLADGTSYLPADPWQRAQVLRWMFFEEDYVQNGVASLRHLVMTGKDKARSAEVMHGKRAASVKALAILDRWLAPRQFLVECGYTVADMAVYAYVSVAHEGGLSLADFRHVARWLDRVRAQPGFLAKTHPYAIDPLSHHELP